MRIVIGGISHETNSFNPKLTRIEDFRIKRNYELLSDESVKPFTAEGAELIPTLWAEAIPSGPVEGETYRYLKESLLRHIRDLKGIDGICLFLHGAMTVEEIGDGENDLVKSIREVAAADTLISVSLDLHGNISPELLEYVDILTAYRTAPHIDRMETRQRALSLLIACIKKSLRPTPVIVKIPMMIPGDPAITDAKPASDFYSELAEIDKTPGILNSSLLIGYSWADSPSTGSSVIVVAEEKRFRDQAYRKACQLAAEYWKKRNEFRFAVATGTIDETIRMAQSFDKKPVFISDSGDNVTSGAGGDLPLFVERLLSNEVKDAVVGGIIDPQAVDCCRIAGIGCSVELEIGGKLDRVNGLPLKVTGKVANLTDDGAVLSIGGVDVILTVRRHAFIMIDSFRSYGIEPEERKIVVVKLGYLFPELRQVAAESLIALSPGFASQSLELDFQHVSRPIFPLDRDFSWEPQGEVD